MNARNAPKYILIAGVSLALASCATPAPPPPPPPPMPIVKPSMPTPPNGAVVNMQLPSKRPDGQRVTINRDLNSDESLWHFRSAFNVAALYCQGPQYDLLTGYYNDFLNNNRRELNRANSAIEAKYRSDHGSGYQRIRDTHSTSVYNFFSLPPVKTEFCNMTMEKAQQLQFIDSNQLSVFALQALNDIDMVFNNFFDAYEKYQYELAQWNVLYNPAPAAPSYQQQNNYDYNSDANDVSNNGSIYNDNSAGNAQGDPPPQLFGPDG